MSAASGDLNRVLRGKVSADQQALVAVEIMDGEGRPRPVEVVLDTGFTGYLTLPPESIHQLGLPSVGQRTFELANGELYEFQVYLGRCPGMDAQAMCWCCNRTVSHCWA